MIIDINTEMRAYRKALSMPKKEILELIKNSGLRGRSGNNFLSWIKIASVMNKDKTILICNIEESEVGTFKDRFLVKRNPDLLMEGLLILAHLINAIKIFIYISDKELIKPIREAINRSDTDKEIIIAKSPGCYICGEETALINSLEGRRPQPRLKPPLPMISGYNGLPTLVHNPETIAMIPLIILNKFDKNLQLFSISGNISNPGVYEYMLGSTIKGLMDIVKPIGKPIALMFGASGGVIPYTEDLLLDYDYLKSKEITLGSRSIIIINDEQDLLTIFREIAGFFSRESCGLCTPCREGNPRVLKIIEKFIEGIANRKDLELLKELAIYISNNSRCGLGKSSMNWLKTSLMYFPQIYEDRINAKDND